MLHNLLTDDPRFERRLGGTGPLLSPLEWDVHAYLALNGAPHDSAIAAWTIKTKYDSIRPVSMIRYLVGLGQSSDPSGESYNENGLPLVPGLIELITVESAAAGQRHEHLAEHVGELALFAWKGLLNDPETQTAGVGWIRGADWTPYHLRGFPTPNFAGYISGHSTFSRAGAEVLTLLTGSPYFPGGVKEFGFDAGQVLNVEYGPSEDVTVQVATFYDAADLTGVARIFCGVHIAADDFVGRKVGARAGVDAFLKMRTLRSGLENMGAMEAASVRYAMADNDATIVAFGFADGENNGLPTQIVTSPEAASVASQPGIYAIFPGANSGHTRGQSQIVVNGRSVSEVSVRGAVDATSPLAIEFAVPTSEPILVMLYATAVPSGAPLTESALTATLLGRRDLPH